MNSPSTRSTSGFVASWDSQRITLRIVKSRNSFWRSPDGSARCWHFRSSWDCQVAADVDLPVRVRDLVNDLELPIIHSRMLGFLGQARIDLEASGGYPPMAASISFSSTHFTRSSAICAEGSPSGHPPVHAGQCPVLGMYSAGHNDNLRYVHAGYMNNT